MWQMSRSSRHTRDLGLKYNPRYKDLMNLVHEVEDVRIGHLEKQLYGLSQPVRYSPQCDGGGGILDYRKGWASIVDKNTIEISSSSGSETISTENILLASGSKPRMLPQYPLDGKYFMSSDEIMDMEKFPESLLIVGAGVIGCEFATIFGNFGKTEVHLLNQCTHRLLPNEDRDISELLTKNFTRYGIHVHNDIMLLDLEKIPSAFMGRGGLKVTMGVECSEEKAKRDPMAQQHRNGKWYCTSSHQPPFLVEKVLFSVGRIPNTPPGLDKLGVKFCGQGGVKADEHARVLLQEEGQKSNVWAAGDVTADVGLVNVAEMEGRAAVEDMYNPEPQDPVSYKNISSIMFLKPEVACVGMNEREARIQGVPHRTVTLRTELSPRALVNLQGSRRMEQDRFGFVKLIVTDDKEKTLLGMRAAGDGASAIVEAVAILIERGECVRTLDRVLHPHPAITEAVQEAARMLIGKGIYKPHIYRECTLTHWTPREGEEHTVKKHEDLPAARILVPTYNDQYES